MDLHTSANDCTAKQMAARASKSLSINDAATGNSTNRNFVAGFWRLADPKITLASMASIFLGACVAAAQGEIHAGWLVMTIAGFFAIEVAKNASGDIYDFETDMAVAHEDRTDFSGGKRVLVDGLLSRSQTWAIAIAFYMVGIGIGVGIVVFREPLAIWPGVIGLLLAWSYNGPPGSFAYRGLGELDVAICYGPLICISAYLIQLGEVSSDVVLVSIPLGILIAAFLWINEFPDYEADRKVQKRNLIVRLGRYRASRLLPLIQGSAFLIVALLPLMGLPRGIWLGGLALVPAAWVAVRTWQDPERCYRHAPVSGGALIAFLLLSLGMGVGVLI
ncbi:MAG: prenyltransferase [Pseudomonadales bacterium]